MPPNLMKRLTLLALLFAATVEAGAQSWDFGFGQAVVAGDDFVMVSRTGTADAGTVVVFERNEAGAWALGDVLRGSQAAPGDRFGHVLHRDGDRLFVGAPAGPQPGAGAVYVFSLDRRTGFWSETARLAASPEDYVGGSLAVLDSMVVTGGMTGGGHLTVFRQAGDAWARDAAIPYPDTSAAHWFGLALQTDGRHIFAGAPASRNGSGSVLAYDARTLALSARLQASGDAGALGAALATAEDGLLLAGAPGTIAEINPTGSATHGTVAGFRQQSDGTWAQTLSLKASGEPRQDFFGAAISTHGPMLLIGAPGSDAPAGQAHLYVRKSTGSWAPQSALAPPNDMQGFGHAVAIAGGTALVAAPFGDGTAMAYAVDHATGAAAEPAALTGPAALQLVSGGPAECTEGRSWQFDCLGVDLVSFLSIEDMGGADGIELNDIWGWTDPATGNEYALVGRMDGTAFVDVSDPEQPRYLGELPLTAGAQANFWRDIKVYRNHAYIVADRAGDHGMQVFDLTQLRALDGAPVTFDATAHYGRIESAHNIIINEDTGFAYIVGSSSGGEVCGGGLHMVDIRNPPDPVFAGCFAHTGTGNAGTGYTHDAQCVLYRGPDTAYQGREICLGLNQNALSIADVTDKANPVPVSSATYPDFAYTHQGWLTEDHRYFYVNDELDEIQGRVVGTRTLIWDLMDLDDPLLLRSHLSENLASDHNLYIRGNLMYQSNYLSGLRILDITNIEVPKEVGFYDTVPTGRDKPGFGGSWSNYPFFESGIIVITSIGEGLFVLRRQDMDL